MSLYLIITIITGLILGSVITFRVGLSEKRFLINNYNELKTLVEEKNQQITRLSQELIIYKADARNNLDKLNEHKNNKEKLTLTFENLANRIFEEKSYKFTEQNLTNLTSLLNPLNEKIKDFEYKVDMTYNIEGKERASLKEQINQLTNLNQQMNQETKNLTKALKGEAKTQGNWGEMILESILTKSGLVKNREYVVQATFTSHEGRRYQPDVIINLPENKSLIIDSKVSLTAYERFTNGDEESIKEHITSIKAHIKNLSGKNYQNLYNITTLDFVLLFVPIESALALAIQHENSLFEEALKNNIILMSPSTLIATIRTIANIWRHENSAQNANEIARLGGELYDRISNFLSAMTDIENAILSLQNKYSLALTKINGNQGITKSALKLKALGAKVTKEI